MLASSSENCSTSVLPPHQHPPRPPPVPRHLLLPPNAPAPSAAHALRWMHLRVPPAELRCILSLPLQILSRGPASSHRRPHTRPFFPVHSLPASTAANRSPKPRPNSAATAAHPFPDHVRHRPSFLLHQLRCHAHARQRVLRSMRPSHCAGTSRNTTTGRRSGGITSNALHDSCCVHRHRTRTAEILEKPSHDHRHRGGCRARRWRRPVV